MVASKPRIADCRCIGERDANADLQWIIQSSLRKKDSTTVFVLEQKHRLFTVKKNFASFHKALGTLFGQAHTHTHAHGPVLGVAFLDAGDGELRTQLDALLEVSHRLVHPLDQQVQLWNKTQVRTRGSWPGGCSVVRVMPF